MFLSELILNNSHSWCKRTQGCTNTHFTFTSLRMCPRRCMQCGKKYTWQNYNTFHL